VALDWLCAAHRLSRTFKTAVKHDINGDGFDDIIIGEPDWPQPIYKGRVTIYIGTKGGLWFIPMIITGKNAGDYFGGNIASAGHFDNDIYDDFVVTAPYVHNAAGHTVGAAYFFRGAKTDDLKGCDLATPPCAAASLLGANPDGHFGLSLAGLGDINGDGLDDVKMGARGASGIRKVLLYHGTSSLTDALAPSEVVTGATFSDF
jgi:hypothetical protein